MSSDDEMNDSERLIRIDERVKYLCDTTDKLVEKQGQLKTKAEENEKDIEALDNDISYNRKIYIGGVVLTIFIFVVTQFLLQGGT